MSSPDRRDHRPLIFAALSGLLFGAGLAVSRMTDPDKVLGFLEIAGTWDPSLGLVMAGALAVSLPGYAWVRRRGRPFCGELQLPTRSDIDGPLVVGAALFGIGWGMAGYCPGPALAGLVRGLASDAYWFVPAMLAGFWLANRWSARR